MSLKGGQPICRSLLKLFVVARFLG